MSSCGCAFAQHRKQNMGSARLCHKRVGRLLHWSLMRNDWGSNAQRFVAQATASVVEMNSQADSQSAALDSIAQAEDAYGASKIQVKPSL
jgi:hypothetical protein